MSDSLSFLFRPFPGAKLKASDFHLLIRKFTHPFIAWPNISRKTVLVKSADRVTADVARNYGDTQKASAAFLAVHE